MTFLIEIVVGLVLAVGFSLFLNRLPDRRRHLLLGISLVVAALIYVAFAVVGLGLSTSDTSWVMVELGGVVLYSAFAYLGVRSSPVYLAIGWLLHIVWDTVVHSGEAFVPAFYPAVCIGFDVAVAAYVIYLLTKTSEN